MLRAPTISCAKSPGTTCPSIARAPRFATPANAMSTRTGVAVAHRSPARSVRRGSGATRHTRTAAQISHHAGLISADTTQTGSRRQPLPGARRQTVDIQGWEEQPLPRVVARHHVGGGRKCVFAHELEAVAPSRQQTEIGAEHVDAPLGSFGVRA